jgi:hypothetical protein
LCLALAASRAHAQEVWPPSLPELPRSAAPARGNARAFPPGFLELVLPKIVQYDTAECGEESARVLAWQKDRKGVGATDGSVLIDENGAALPVSPALAAALRNAESYLGMTPATQGHEPTHAEITAAVFSSAGVEDVAKVFERTIAARLTTPTGTIVPEAGGEATLDGAMSLHEIPEMTRAVLPEVVRSARDPEALARLYERRLQEMKAIDPDGLLANVLKSRGAWIARGLPLERIARVLDVAVDGILRNATDSYIFDPQTQLAAVVSQGWSGRYVGRWHTHPPRARTNGWGNADGPSPPDMDIAVQEGQNMVFVFYPDGFDFFDLAPLSGAKPDLNKVLKESYRSDDWRRRFQDLFDRSFPARP